MVIQALIEHLREIYHTTNQIIRGRYALLHRSSYSTLVFQSDHIFIYSWLHYAGHDRITRIDYAEPDLLQRLDEIIQTNAATLHDQQAKQRADATVQLARPIHHELITAE